MKILSVLFYILKRGGSQDLRRIMFNKNNTKLFLFSLLLIKLSGVTNTGSLNFLTSFTFLPWIAVIKTYWVYTFNEYFFL